MSELKITEADIGKRFRRRDGTVVPVTEWVYDAWYPVITDNRDHYTEDGFFYSNATESSLDLVERLDDATAATPESIPMASDATLRDDFAGKAIQSILAGMPESKFIAPKAVASFAYAVADAMLAERAKGVK